MHGRRQALTGIKEREERREKREERREKIEDRRVKSEKKWVLRTD